MVGGDVIEVVVCKDRVWVRCQEESHPLFPGRGGRCAVNIERTPEAEKVRPGDCFWWQAGCAMWTPARNRTIPMSLLKQGTDWDVVIPRLGYSGAVRPPEEEIETRHG